MIDRASVVAKLKARASIAAAIGEEEAARLLRGYATTIAADPKAAMSRIRSAIAARVVPFSPALIDVVWADALADIAGQSSDLARELGLTEQALVVARAEVVQLRTATPQAEELAARDRRVERVEAEAARRVLAAEKRIEHAEAEVERRILAAERKLEKAEPDAAEREAELARALAGAGIRAAEAEEATIALRRGYERRTQVAAAIAVSRLPLSAAASTKTCAERLAAHVLPDERTWLRLTEETAALEDVPMVGVLERRRTPKFVHVRKRVWWWLRVEALRLFGVTYSYPDIGRAWGRDHTTIMAGVVAYEAEIAAALPSGARLREVA